SVGVVPCQCEVLCGARECRTGGDDLAVRLKRQRASKSASSEIGGHYTCRAKCGIETSVAVVANQSKRVVVVGTAAEDSFSILLQDHSESVVAASAAVYIGRYDAAVSETGVQAATAAIANQRECSRCCSGH